MFSFLSGNWLEGFPECPWTGQKALNPCPQLTKSKKEVKELVNQLRVN
jgi:hypothetical protein